MAKPMTPVPFTDVTLNDVFWRPRMDTNRDVTLEINYKHNKSTGRLGQFTWKPGDHHEPHIFWDSDVAKWMEAVAYSLTTHPDKSWEKRLDAVIDDLEAMQQKDGYLNTHFILVEPGERWRNIKGEHELYCAGHLIEAAVAYFYATGKRKFLDIMCRYADCIDKTFGPKKGQKRGYPGHQELELALVKLYHATDEKRYLDLATFFVNERGKRPNGKHYYDVEAEARGASCDRDHAYCQAHVPLREQTQVVGHAVRAMYLYAGAADVAAETNDTGLLKALDRLWDNLVNKRMHVTGGIGPTSQNEGFTFDYDMPDETAYLETCAAIGLVFWAHRLTQFHRDRKYSDVMELALYNGMLSGVSLSGDRFFYENPTASFLRMRGIQHGESEFYRYQRSAWFGCACCPTNVVRIMASLSGYQYSVDRNAVYTHLYAAGKATVNVAGQQVAITQSTKYPWKETVNFTVRPERDAEFTLALRIPGWCRNATCDVNGKRVKLDAITRKGYAHITRTWSKGDKVKLVLDMPVERIEAHPSARQPAGMAALKRGPVLYCLEQVDNFEGLHDLRLPADAKLTAKWEPDLLGGVVTLNGKAKKRKGDQWKRTKTDGKLFSHDRSKLESVTIKAVPYYAWCNRDLGEMRTWILEG
jgi:DUF1680 family protein